MLWQERRHLCARRQRVLPRGDHGLKRVATTGARCAGVSSHLLKRRHANGQKRFALRQGRGRRYSSTATGWRGGQICGTALPHAQGLDRVRRVIGKAEITQDKCSPRCIVTGLTCGEDWVHGEAAFTGGRSLDVQLDRLRCDMKPSAAR